MSDIKKIGIDVDGVLRDFSGDLYEVVKRERPQWLKPGVDVITEWDMEKCFNASRDELKEMYWYRHVDELFGNGKSFSGNVEFLRWMMENTEHKYYCISSQKKHARHYTLKWLGNQQLNFEEVRFVRGEEKWKQDVDFLLDDSPENYDAWTIGRRDNGFILMDTPHNQNVVTHNRVKTMEEFYERFIK